MVHLWIMNRIIHFFQKHKNVWNDKLGIRIQNRKLNSQIYWSFQQNHEQIFWITIAQDLDLCRYNISSTEGEDGSDFFICCVMFDVLSWLYSPPYRQRSTYSALRPSRGKICGQRWWGKGCRCTLGALWCTAVVNGSPVLCSLDGM